MNKKATNFLLLLVLLLLRSRTTPMENAGTTVSSENLPSLELYLALLGENKGKIGVT